MPMTADIPSIRERFPALESELIYLENAGGSQLPASVIGRMTGYLIDTFVQLGAPYERSARATAIVREAHDWMNLFVHAGEIGSCILGASTSTLLAMLAQCFETILEPGDEIVLAETAHESNVTPWLRLERQGITLRWWRYDERVSDLAPDGLSEVLSPRTKLVCFPHVSNLLGGIVDAAEAVRRAHAVGARVVVDGVAFAPHRAVDVQALGADFYAFSAYKVFAPHIGVLFARHDAVDDLTGPNHFFIPRRSVPYKFELGGVNHEACAGLLGMRDYVKWLGGGAGQPEVSREMIERAFAIVEACERPLQELMIRRLCGSAHVRIIGPASAGPGRVPTVSFLLASESSARATMRLVGESTGARPAALRHGHMYAHRLCTRLGIEPEDGVVRLSAVHYNTAEEIDLVMDRLG